MIRRFAAGLFFVLSSLAQAANPLPPSLAFRPFVQALDAQTIEVRFDISEGYYLYRDKFAFQPVSPEIRLGSPVFPAGKKKFDENFGEVAVYYQEASLRIPVEPPASKAREFLLEVTSQGCSEAVGLCYPPQKQRFSVTLPAAPSLSAASALSSVNVPNDESGRIAQFLGHTHAAWAALTFFGFGLLLSLTPCVLPMLPVLSGIILGIRGKHETPRSTGILLSLAYVSGMATAYALAGVLAGFSGTLFSGVWQTPWARGGLALLFVLLAFSMFGFYTLRLPACLQSPVASGASRLKGRSLMSVALMGGASALIIAPCVAPPLAGALLYIGHSGNAALGGGVLFCMAWGMGVPLLIVGASAGHLLPASGPWMNAVNRFFGLVLLGVAHWLMAIYLPVSVQMFLWGGLFLAPVIALRALDPLPARSSLAQRFWKLAGFGCLLASMVLIVGAIAGAKDPLRPLDWNAEAPRLAFERIRSPNELERRLNRSRGRVMLDFYADWCDSCKKMERTTFSDVRIRKALSNLTLLQVDVTALTDDDQALLTRFGLFGPPGILFLDEEGREKTRVIGFQDAERFLETLKTLD